LLAGDGREVRSSLELAAEFVVVGSGPAGSAVARELARGGASVIVLEEGLPFDPAAPRDAFSAFARWYRDLGGRVARGRAFIPVVQGRAIGGTSVVNGAISWRLPRDVWDGWVREDPAFADAHPWDELLAGFAAIEADLSIAPTDPRIAGPKNLLLARGADALGLEHRPIARNVRDCLGRGECLSGCVDGRKQSMDRTLLPEAARLGAEIWAGMRVERLCVEGGRAVAVRGRASGGGRFIARARRGVVVAASAIDTPALLLGSGIRHGPVGRNLMGHPGYAVTGRFAEPVRAWRGATQGHEVIGLRQDGLKFEALGYDLGMYGLRTDGLGAAWARRLDGMQHDAHWGVAVKAEARGTVDARAGIAYAPTERDLGKARRGIAVLCELFLAAGAIEASPGVHGGPGTVRDVASARALAESLPRDPRAYASAVTHLFGTCRMGSRADANVVGLDFRHHAVGNLWIADSSVFPSNTGVNPQTSILVMAQRCGRALLRREP
jgi:choline dehydrogenase-like flavoprotein